MTEHNSSVTASQHTPFFGMELRLEPIQTIAQAKVQEGLADDVRYWNELVPPGTYARRPPIYVDAKYALPETRTAIEQYFAIVMQRHQGISLVELRNAAVTGQGALVTHEGKLVRDSVLEFVAHGKAPDGFSRVSNDLYSLNSVQAHRRIEEPCILVKRPWYNNFGHWLVDGASVVALAQDAIRAHSMTIVVGKLANQKVREVILSSIQAIVPDVRILEAPDSELWLFDRLFYLTPPHVPPLFKSPEAICRLRSIFAGNIPKFTPGRRVFISRSRAHSRRLVNEEEVMALCAQYGFEVVVPETLSFREQVKLFAEAEALIGVKGAAFANAMFCAPDAKVMLISPSDFPDPFFWDIVSQIGCEYSEIFGPVTTNISQGLNDFLIEASQVLRMLSVAGM